MHLSPTYVKAMQVTVGTTEKKEKKRKYELNMRVIFHVYACRFLFQGALYEVITLKVCKLRRRFLYFIISIIHISAKSY